MESNYITTSDYNKDIPANKIKSKGFIVKSAISEFINNG